MVKPVAGADGEKQGCSCAAFHCLCSLKAVTVSDPFMVITPAPSVAPGLAQVVFVLNQFHRMLTRLCGSLAV